MPERDASLAEVVGRQLKRNLVAGQNTDVVLAHLSRRIRRHGVTVVQNDAKTRIRQNLVYRAVHFNKLFFGQYQTPGVDMKAIRAGPKPALAIAWAETRPRTSAALWRT